MLKKIEHLNCADIPEKVMIRAHYNGLMKRVTLRGAEDITDAADKSSGFKKLRIPVKPKERGEDYIRRTWTSREELINESFNAILMTLPPASLGDVFGSIFPELRQLPMYVTNLHWEYGANAAIGDADIVLSDIEKKIFILIELKIQAKASNGRFSLQQHTKYSNYIQVLKKQGLTAKVVLLAPSDDYRQCLAEHEADWFECTNGDLIPTKNQKIGCPAYVNNESVKDYASFMAYQRRKCKEASFDFVDPEEFQPIRYVAFERFGKELCRVAPHLQLAFKKVFEYATRALK